MALEQKPQHFLLVSFPPQSHINPTLQLAHRLTAAGAHVTFSTTVSGHRLMFPTKPTYPLDDPNNPLLSFSPFSDGHDNGFDNTKHNGKDYMSYLKVVGYKTLRPIASAAATAHKPAVTCIVYALLLPWAAKVARDLGLPSVLFWIQPTAVFSVYYHYFHEYRGLIDTHRNDPSFEINLPGLPPLKVRDFPSFLVHQSDTDAYGFLFHSFEEVFQGLDEEGHREVDVKGPGKTRVLVNSFDSLEHEVTAAWTDADTEIEFVPVGPLLPRKSNDFVEDVVKSATTDAAKDEYMEWLDGWPEKSVVYLSFGSMLSLSKRQNTEFSRALAKSGRPYLWVVREDREGVEAKESGVAEGWGMVVGWCSQLDVLSHPSVGCFVTHCGWNSTLESLACGVPMVALPQWTDQLTNASLVERLWGTGVRMGVNEEGVAEEGELRRCLDLVMGEGDDGAEIRMKAGMLREKAREAINGEGGGSSGRNLKAFVDEIGF